MDVRSPDAHILVGRLDLKFLRLLRDANPYLATCVTLDVRERRLCVIMSSQLLELLLDSPTTFHCEFEVLAQFSVGPLTVWMEDFEKTRNGFSDSLFVTSR